MYALTVSPPRPDSTTCTSTSASRQMPYTRVLSLRGPGTRNDCCHSDDASRCTGALDRDASSRPWSVSRSPRSCDHGHEYRPIRVRRCHATFRLARSIKDGREILAGVAHLSVPRAQELQRLRELLPLQAAARTRAGGGWTRTPCASSHSSCRREYVFSSESYEGRESRELRRRQGAAGQSRRCATPGASARQSEPESAGLGRSGAAADG